MEKRTKKEYIDAWNGHVDVFNRLAFCSNKEYADVVNECMTKLKEVIPKIADTKTHFTGD